MTSSLWPREHGAISMLVQPIVCAAIIAIRWHWSVIPTVVVVAAMFLVREPLIVLGRQRWVWREPHPESLEARRWLAVLIPLIAACGALLMVRWQLAWLVAFGFGATAMTLYAVWMTVRNRQRSVWLQILSAIGLTSTGMAVALSLLGQPAPWAWWLWLLSAAQAAAGILLVHARLEAHIATKAKRPESPVYFRAATWMQVLLIPLGAAAWRISPWLTAAMVLPAVVHAYELGSLHTPAALATPLRTVGLRAMGLSIIVSVLLIAGLR